MSNSEHTLRNNFFQALIKSAQARRNYDLGEGLYENMDKYKDTAQFIHQTPMGYKSPMKIKRPYKSDDNKIDFPFNLQTDDSNEGGSVLDTSEVVEDPIALGPALNTEQDGLVPGSVGLGEDQTSYPGPGQISGLMDRTLPNNDFEGKNPADQLDFGRDYTDEFDYKQRIPDNHPLAKLIHKYLNSSEGYLFGLPDGMVPISDLDPNATVDNEENPADFGTPDAGLNIYHNSPFL